MNSIPGLRFSPDELARGEPRPDTFLLGCQVLESAGVLMLENAFPPALIAALREAVMTRYALYFEDKEYPDALRVGDKRTMITLTLEPPFTDPGLYANPLVLPIIRRLLGPACILGSFGAVVSLPGAADQHIHRDHPGLFEDEALDSRLPGFAVNMVVPLVALGGASGTTQVWKGSHRVPLKEVGSMDSQRPVVPAGGCLLMDYRLLHGGTANCSDTVRPLLYVIYHRPWFRDYVNFQKQPAVRMSRAEARRVPEAHRALFAWLGTGNDCYWPGV